MIYLIIFISLAVACIGLGIANVVLKKYKKKKEQKGEEA